MAEEVKEVKKPRVTKKEEKIEKVDKVKKTEKVEEVKEVKKPRATKKVEKNQPLVAEEFVQPVVKRKKKASNKSQKTCNILTGKRKDAVARVRLVEGHGKITINDRDIDDYFMLDTLKLIVRQPLKLTDTENKYDIIVNVYGGGYTGQTGAIRHAISKALVKENEMYKAELKKAGFLTRDSRKKERKKYGLKKARKAPQFSKR